MAILVEKCRFLVLLMSRKEAEFTVYVRGDGRMTVPKEVRDALSIKEGDLVECRLRKIRRG